MERHLFKLYVAGDSDLAARARANFERIVRPRLGETCVLEVIDILADPGIARANRIVATPMLVRELPLPVIKMLGDLSDDDKVILQLSLPALPPNHSNKALP